MADEVVPLAPRVAARRPAPGSGPVFGPASGPAVSVIVPAYGVADVLGEALASLQAQRWRDWEAIVVDDGSPDDVAAVFSRFAGDRRFRLLQTDNRGVAVARNRAVAASRAPFVAMLDGDDRYEPAYLARMLAAIRADDRLGFVGCDAALFGGREPTGSRYSQRYAMAGPVTVERVMNREVNIFTAAIVRRAAFDAVGGFDESLAVSEDFDLWIRLLTAGWDASVLAEALVHYRRRAGSLSSSTRRLLLGSSLVYRKASAALRGRPERAAADRQLASCQRELRWLDGEDLILSGDLRRGLALLEGAERRSPRWRAAMILMRRAPGLATLMLRARAWLPDLSKSNRRSAHQKTPRGSAGLVKQ